MLKIIVITCIIAAVYALDCTNLATGYYCDGTGYTLCVNGYGYSFACAAGTACQCGQGNECDTPCTTACETGTSDATPYCNARLVDFAGEQGYFCDADGSGFYQCVRDAFCPSQASPRSQLISCPLGTECRCENTFMECSFASIVSPCVTPLYYIPYTTGTTGSSEDCGSYRWDCINFSQGDTAHTCIDDSCPAVGNYGVCFSNADTNTGSCAADLPCFGLGECNTASDCGSPDDWICAINTCCGAAGVCLSACNNE